MPTLPLNVLQQSKRLGEQRWLLDLMIQVAGPEWDQDRISYYTGACGATSGGEFQGLKQQIKKYDDMARIFAQAARGQELAGREALSKKHKVTARNHFFTAAVMYGAAQWPIAANTEFNLVLARKKRECYDQFAPLSAWPVERVDLPFGGKKVGAYLHLQPGAEKGHPLPCVVVTSGMDGFKEIAVALEGDPLLSRGFVVLAVDVPGQGESLTSEIWWDPKTFPQLASTIFDYCKGRPEIDSDKIFVQGNSYGSYWASLLAASEPRFAGCGVLMTCFEPGGFSIMSTASPTFRLRQMYMTNIHDDVAFDAFCATLNNKALIAGIRCPYLVCAGEDDQLSDIAATYTYMNAVTAPKTMFLYQGENHGLHSRSSGQMGPEAFTVVADWFLDRAAGEKAQSQHVLVNMQGRPTVTPWKGDLTYQHGWPPPFTTFD